MLKQTVTCPVFIIKHVLAAEADALLVMKCQLLIGEVD
jgi:hypothetical protein